MSAVESIAQNLGLGALLAELNLKFCGYELLDHWQRGEFHHDLLLRVEPQRGLPGPVLVVATNCNGGVHWFDPCALLGPDARSEYRPEFRERQPGGGWQLKSCAVKKDAV